MSRVTVVRAPWARRLIVTGSLLVTAFVPHATAAPGPHTSPPPAERELVVVIHGLGRSPLSMRPISRSLEEAGYEVLQHGYSSTCCAIPELVGELRAAIAARLTPEHTRVHFVGHSMGNILVRYLLTSDWAPPRVGRVVMLAPPNQGAVRANQMTPFVGWLWKPTSELRADSAGTVRDIPRIEDVEIGVIAARDDDTVRLPETHLAEEKEHIVVDGGHSFIMNRREVQALTLTFIRAGSFSAVRSPAQGTRVTSSP